MRKDWLVLMLLALLLAGCDGSGWREYIPAQAYPSGNVLELRVGAQTNPGDYAAYGGSRFRSELSMAQIVARGGSEDFTARELFRGTEEAGMLLTVQSEDERQDFYWLTPTGQDGEAKWYCFTGLRTCLQSEDEEAGERADVLFPVFALDAAAEDKIAPELILGQEYRCSAVTAGENAYPDAQSFFTAFYRGSGWYDVEQDGNTLIVQEKCKDAAAFWLMFRTENEASYLTVLRAGS